VSKKRPQPGVARAIFGRNDARAAPRRSVTIDHIRAATAAQFCSLFSKTPYDYLIPRPSNGSLGDASRPRRLGKRHLQLVAGESARFKFRKVSDIGQHSGTLCALQTATGGLRCPGLKQRPQALFGLGALWRLACPNFRLSQRPLSLSGLGIVTGHYPPVSTFSRNLVRLTMGWRHAFRPPHIPNDSQRQKGGGEQGERWRKRGAS
jgi:hypothetical protein